MTSADCRTKQILCSGTDGVWDRWAVGQMGCGTNGVERLCALYFLVDHYTSSPPC